MPSALCRCSIAILPAPAHRRGRPPPMVATPAAPISPPPRPAALPTSPSTRSAASPLPRWSRALGSTVVCATSAPASRRRSPASSARMAPPVAPGADWTTSRPTSGPPWWRTIWCCSPGSNRLSRARLQADENKADQDALNCSFADSRLRCCYQCAKCAHRPSRSCRSAPATPLRKRLYGRALARAELVPAFPTEPVRGLKAHGKTRRQCRNEFYESVRALASEDETPVSQHLRWIDAISAPEELGKLRRTAEAMLGGNPSKGLRLVGA